MWLWLRLREDEATILVVFWSSVYFGSFAGHYWGKLRKGGWNIKDTVTTCKKAVAKDNRPVIKKLLGGYGALRKKGWGGGGEKGRQGSVVFQLHLRRSLFQTKQKKVTAAVEYCDPRSLKDVFVSHIFLYHSYHYTLVLLLMAGSKRSRLLNRISPNCAHLCIPHRLKKAAVVIRCNVIRILWPGHLFFQILRSWW